MSVNPLLRRGGARWLAHAAGLLALSAPSLAQAAPPDRFDVLVVFVDFDDISGTLDFEEYENQWKAPVLDYFDTMSNGQLDLNLVAFDAKYTVGPRRLYHSCDGGALLPGEECLSMWSDDGPLPALLADGEIEVSDDGIRPNGGNADDVFEAVLFVNPTLSTCDDGFPGWSIGGQRPSIDPGHSYHFGFTRLDWNNDCVTEPYDSIEAWHELGHQIGAYSHPASYDNRYEMMDSGHGAFGAFTRINRDLMRPGYLDWFSGWLPDSKVVVLDPTSTGATVPLSPIARRPSDVAGAQAILVETNGGYDYVVECRRPIGVDENMIADEGTVILRAMPGASPETTVMAADGLTPSPSSHLDPGQTFTDADADVQIVVGPDVGDACLVTVTYGPMATDPRPDVAMVPWYSEPMNQAETTDIWVDSSCNGYEEDDPSDPTRLLLGRRTDTEQTVIGNGDNACLFHENRIYARVRNLGTAPAAVSDVNIDVTQPLGVGIRGADGWANVGMATVSDFPGLASIPPNGYVDVWVPWTPEADVDPGALGAIDLHSCTRVRVHPVAGEAVTSNHDGIGEQENLARFEIVLDMMSGTYAPGTGEIFITNTGQGDRDYVLGVEDDLPDGWTWQIGDGTLEHTLAPGEVRVLPVEIIPAASAPVLETYHLDVRGYEIVPEYDDTGTIFRYHSHEIDAVTFEGTTLPKTELELDAFVVGDANEPEAFVVHGCFDVGVPGATVTLDFIDPLLKITPKQVTMDAVSCFEYEFAPPSGGPWQVRAYWAGTDTMASATKTVPITAPCCEPSTSPGCSDPDIEACVCGGDAYCCTTAWDSICVAEVEAWGCGTCS